MSQPRTDEERVLKMCERMRLLIAIDDEIPAKTKLETQPVLKLLEAAVAEEDRAQASQHYSLLYRELNRYPDLEALLAAMRVFLPHL
ncbi:MAG TPA: hypothetical protein VEB21_10220 [Terriglobales bacterium]|nr:hypothetical protein [Terriglobales bacterium]